MDRVWQWAWDRQGTRYRWAVFLLSYAVTLPLWETATLIIVAFEESDRFLEAGALAATVALATVFVLIQPWQPVWRLVEGWAADDQVDRLEALESTYTYARNVTVWAVGVFALTGGIGVRRSGCDRRSERRAADPVRDRRCDVLPRASADRDPRVQ